MNTASQIVDGWLENRVGPEDTGSLRERISVELELRSRAYQQLVDRLAQVEAENRLLREVAP